ncbi:UDP pyrophosphate phosphatase [Hazenella sp. IB182357]|uniref:Undecaprenyl-diphosphatase n=1 Tax=Polycladospora coralii TaxID=2771432 RepID=A0A926RU24_9BACL|nr:undecaprenyl-diphosphate phosphatase [Polycladospora coralii]MBD1371864.1 UDP pyrophosphate phosphatase [Polycladospora coralii]
MEQLIDLLKYLLLGLFQGFTEPIPVSSSGHLVIAQEFLGIETENISLLALLNFASLLAVLVIYWDDITRLLLNSVRHIEKPCAATRSDFRYVLYLIIGTLPAMVIGLLGKDFIDLHLNRIETVGITLIITGCALWFIRKSRGWRADGDLTMKDAWLVGLGQAVALTPGISRSGATIVVAMLLGMHRETAFRFSFLLYIPVSLGGFILGIGDFLEEDLSLMMIIIYLISLLGAFIMTYFSLKWFMNIMAKGKLGYFAIYCFIVGPAVLIYSFL